MCPTTPATEEWFFMLRVPGVWRAMFPVRGDVTDAEVMTSEFARVLAGRDDYRVKHIARPGIIHGDHPLFRNTKVAQAPTPIFRSSTSPAR